MFIAPPPPSDHWPIGPFPERAARTRRNAWIDSFVFLGLCALVSIGIVGASHTAVAEVTFDANKNELAIETIELSQYPIPGSVYESTGGTTFTAAAIAINVAISTTVARSDGPGLPLPGPGEMTSGESLSNISVSFQGFPVKWEGPGLNSYSVRPVVESESASDVLALSGEIPNGAWDVELLAMELTGELMGMDGSVTGIIRESPTLASLGRHVLTPLPDGGLHIGSFFDVFFELSLDGGPFVPADGPMRLDITAIVPEPVTMTLLGTAIAALSVARRRYRRGA
jgi:hypothetical protein